MQKIYVLALAALVGGSAFGQSIKQLAPMKSKSMAPVTNKKATGALKSAAIWENNFDNPSDWVINNNSGNNDNWVIGTGVPSGPFAIDGIQSTSGGNFGLFDSDALCSNNQLANLQVANPIDLSPYAAVSLQFEEFYRRFQDKTYIEVSNDGGTTWVKYEVNKTLAVNQAVANNPTIVVVDITPTAAGQAAVLFRFRYEGGCDYAWMVDDVKIIETPANNITLNTSWHGDIINDYEYRQVPLSQSHDLVFGAVISNDGALDQQNVRMNLEVRNTTTSTTVTYTSESVNLAKAASDTLNYVLPKLTVAGEYQFIITILNDGTDATPDNNTITRNFSLTAAPNKVFSHGAPAWGGGFYAPFDVTGNPGFYEPFTALNNFKVYENGDMLYAVGMVLAEETNPGQEIVIEVFQYNNPAAPDPDDKTSLASETYILKPEDISVDVANQVILRGALSTPVPVVAGQVYGVGIQTFGGSDPVSLGTSGTNNDGSSLIFGNLGSGGTTWYSLGSNPFFTMLLSPSVGISENAKKQFNVSSFPNPAKDKVMLNFSLPQSGTATIHINDIAGKNVFTKSMNAKSGANQLSIENLDLRPGVYYYTVTSNGVSNSNKLVIAK
ncbi:MAG TPA: T9SS type A sorting domain-containing protein [Luteibaculaceae bacterium]|nr:T9SS type A sorting domain-containing protein [Luteibaculaceae bacterium]